MALGTSFPSAPLPHHEIRGVGQISGLGLKWHQEPGREEMWKLLQARLEGVVGPADCWREALVIPAATQTSADHRCMPAPSSWVARLADTGTCDFETVCYLALLWQSITDTSLWAGFSPKASC